MSSFQHGTVIHKAPAFPEDYDPSTAKFFTYENRDDTHDYIMIASDDDTATYLSDDQAHLIIAFHNHNEDMTQTDIIKKDISRQLAKLKLLEKLVPEFSPCPMQAVNLRPTKAPKRSHLEINKYMNGILMTYAGPTLDNCIRSMNMRESILLAMQAIHLVVAVSDVMQLRNLSKYNTCIYSTGPTIQIKFVDVRDWYIIDEISRDKQVKDTRRLYTWKVNTDGLLEAFHFTYTYNEKISRIFDILHDTPLCGLDFLEVHNLIDTNMHVLKSYRIDLILAINTVAAQLLQVMERLEYTSRDPDDEARHADYEHNARKLFRKITAAAKEALQRDI